MLDKQLRGAEPQDGGGSVVVFTRFAQERRHKLVHRRVTAQQERFDE